MTDEANIEAITALIVERFAPLQVILFGSHARGEAGEHSDLDLLVVLPAEASLPRRGNPVRRAIAERFTVPVDVVVQTAPAFEALRRRPGSLAAEATREGVVLYERPAA